MRAEQKHPHQPPPPPQQQWRVNLHARSRNFSIELTAATPIPTWRPREHHHFSLLLRLWSFVLRVQSDCGAGPPRRRRRSLGSRFLGALERIRGSRAQKRAVATREADKAEIGITRLHLVLVLVLISAFLLGAVSGSRLDKIGVGAAAAAPMILARASKKLFASFAAELLDLWSVARSSSRALDLAKRADFAGDWAPRGISRKLWKSAASWNS